MNDVSIGKLSVRVPGGSREEGHALAVQIAAGFASANGLPESGDFPQLRVRIATRPGLRNEQLVDYIITEAVRQLRRVSE